MNTLPIIVWPHPKLNTVCENVDEFNDNLKQLTSQMITTMLKFNGVGLAAPQVGISLNVIVASFFDTTIQQEKLEPCENIVLINPKIQHTRDELFSWEEGCLSVPGYFETRSRPYEIMVNYCDVNGTLCQQTFTGLNAFIIQHEIDHLKGKVFVDDLSKLKKDRIKKKISKHRYFGE
jgi:peptide deformylase